MTVALAFPAVAHILRETVKDRSYRATPLGLEVARYYRWKKNEWGATIATLNDYESILSRLPLFFADLDLLDFAPPLGTERLRECWAHYWGDRSPRTRAKVRSVWIDFFEWAVRERGLPGNPARALTRPRSRDTRIETFTPSFVERVLAAQTYPADWCGCNLVLKYGLRRGGLANVQRRDFDVERRLLTIRSKGERIYTVPIPEEAFWLKLGRLVEWKERDYLIYHQDVRKMRCSLWDAEEILTIGEDQIGYARITRLRHDRRPTGRLVHTWWYRCLARAGVVEEGTMSGMNMHRGRHTSATEMQRRTHDLRLTQLLLGHVDIRSTARYAQLDTADLAEALARLYGE